MKPAPFKGQSEEWRNLPGYEPLPVATQESPAGWVTSCWKLSFRERLRLLFKGRVFITQQTYHYSTNAIFPAVKWEQPNCKHCGSPKELHKGPSNKCPYSKDHISKPSTFKTFEPKRPPTQN